MSVDIVIAVYGSPDHLKRCVESLDKTLRDDKARVYIVDDCSPSHFKSDLMRIYEGLPTRYDVTISAVNRGFAATNNFGVAKGNAEYICLLNSDTQPQIGWLGAMCEVLDNQPNVALVGARMIFPPWAKGDERPSGRIQHAGVAFNVDRMPYHIFLGWSASHPKVMQARLMKAMTAACWLVRRQIYEDFGGLDTRYGQGNFEDIDFCMRLNETGWDIAYCPQALLWHFGSGSNNTESANRNAMLFRSVWYGRIRPDDHLYY